MVNSLILSIIPSIHFFKFLPIHWNPDLPVSSTFSPLCLVKPKSNLIKKIKSTKMAMSPSEVQVLSPHEDSISIPMTSRQTIDDKKEQIEYFFRITIVWREETFQLGSSIAVLSLRGR